MLESVDLARKLSAKAYGKKIAREQLRLRELHFRMYERQFPALALFEGWDAAGKGGAIKRVTETLEPRGGSLTHKRQRLPCGRRLIEQAMEV